MITSNVAFYPCVDIEKTEQFYSKIIGLKLVFSGPGSRIFACGAGGHFGFVEYSDKKAAKGRLCLSLNCETEEQVSEYYQAVIRAGGKPKGEPGLHLFQPVFSFFIEDPNGYLVEFQRIQGVQL